MQQDLEHDDAAVAPSEPGPNAIDPADLMRRVLPRTVIFVAFMAAVLFASAGRLDWWGAWAHVAMMGSIMVGTLVLLVRRCPELIVERMTRRKDAKSWDMVFVALVALVGPLVTWVVAGLEVRFALGAGVPWFVQLIALVVIFVGQLITIRAMLENRFFSAVVRIQRDRGHQVVSTGPYALVRHPGYSGASLVGLALPFLLGSWWAVVPAALTVAVLAVRMVLEDRTLHRELEGYPAYAARVRHLLVPGLF